MQHRLCDTGLVKRASGSMRIDDTSRQYVTAGGERRITRCLLLRRSYRDDNGKPRNETLANLSALPDNAIAALRLALKGATLVDAESVFDVERSIPHGMRPPRTSWRESSACGPCPARRAPTPLT